MRRPATLVARHVGMAVPRFSRDTRSCRSVGSTITHDAKLTADSLGHPGNAETESVAPPGLSKKLASESEEPTKA